MQGNFKEIQRFSQWWIWLILIGLAVLPLVGLFFQEILGFDFGNNPISSRSLVIIFLINLLLIPMLYAIRLKTEIDSAQIRFHFFPFVRKAIPWEEVKTAEVKDYGFVGGWGIRLWTRHGTVYNVKGSQGLVLELKNGKKMVIGTQKPDELKRVIQGL